MTIEQNDSIDLDNGLVPSRRQAIIWSIVSKLYWRICVSRPQ